MKRILLITVFSLPLLCGAQVTFPTVRQVYDFAAGDTFQYRRWTSFGTNLAFCRVILSRTDYANDSIVYISKTIYPAITDTNRLTITLLDSAAYRQTLGYGWNNFSTSISAYAGDTAYDARALTVITRYCDPIIGYRTFDLYADYQCAVGLGETFISINDSGTAGSCAYSWYERLVYLHKTNGQIAGTPDSSLSTAINTVSDQAPVLLSPNPAASFVTIQTAGKPWLPTAFILYDLSGRVVLQQLLSDKHSRVALSDVSRGMYLYTVVTGSKKVGTGKLVVE